MRKNTQSMIGATLLEVMLVLSMIALITLMSVRYYQATNSASQMQQLFAQVQAITGAADSLALGDSTNGYSSVTAANMAGFGTSVTSFEGTAITFTPVGAAPATSYTVVIGFPTSAQSSNICTTVKAKMASNAKYTAIACTATTLTYTYVSTN